MLCGTLGTSGEFTLANSAGATLTCSQLLLVSFFVSTCSALLPITDALELACGSPCPTDPVVEVFRLGVGLLRWPRPDWIPAWMCTSRSLDGHDLMFDTLHRLPSQRLVCFMLPGICLVSLTFRSALHHIQNSSRHFSVMELMTKLSALY